MTDSYRRGSVAHLQCKLVISAASGSLIRYDVCHNIFLILCLVFVHFDGP